VSRSLRQRRARQRAVKARRQRIVIFSAFALVAAVGVGGFALFDWIKGDQAWPTVKTLKPERIGQNSIIYDRSGRVMGVIQADQNRTVIPLKDMGEWLPKAAISIEDRRFREHDGVDYEGVARAAVRNAEAGGVVEGGSTITQQVVRNLYKEITTEQSIKRKAKEAYLARDLEGIWSKDKILETYLNIIFFGHNAYGAEAASLTYFDKRPKALTLPEAALLAGLPQKPTAYDPFRDINSAKKRRDKVLAAMLRDKVITKGQYSASVAAPVRMKRGKIYTYRRLPFFFDYVQKELIQKYGSSTVRLGGLRIHTTIDPKMQRYAETAIHETLNYPNDPSAAMVVMETKTGKIRAMASSSTYDRSKFNLAAQGRRQPGSSAKTWVLAAFVNAGIDPDTTTYTSRPIKVRCTGCTEWWEPKTYDGSYRGSMTIRGATLASDNSVFAQMTLDIGADKVAEMAHKLGIQSPLENVWSIGLGSQVVTPLEQTNVYATVARGGVRLAPTFVDRLTGPSGGLLPNKNPKPVRVLEDWQAGKIVEILEDNVRGGTGTGAQIGRKAGGKTGTTDNHNDAWFCGITPELTACVWMGYPDALQPMYNVHGISVAGGTFPATMWRRFMEKALDGQPEMDWFDVTGTPLWIPFTSTWQDNPGIDAIVSEPPKPKEEDEDKDKDKKDADATDPAATTPTTAEPTPTPEPAPTTPPPPPPPPPAAPVTGTAATGTT
jgi:penicillin-binding protein 1A